MAEHERIAVTQEGAVMIIRLVDAELSDLVLQDSLHEEMLALVKKDQPPKLLVDFGAVNYCTTGVINSLLTIKKTVVAGGGVFKLCGLTGHVHEAFTALNLENTIFDVYKTQAEAIAAFSD
jgi:anti-anti-sigma regulatory factor